MYMYMWDTCIFWVGGVLSKQEERVEGWGSGAYPEPFILILYVG